MAEFIIGNSLRGVARRRPMLRKLLWVIDYVFVWTLIKLYSLLPVDLASNLGYRVGRFVGPLMTNKTKIYKENLTRAFPERSASEIETLTNEAWGRAGRVLGEYPHLGKILRDNNGQRVQIEIKRGAAGPADLSGPVVMAGAHLSNWEVICTAMASLGMENSSLYTPPSNPLLDQLLQKSRHALRSELVDRAHAARALMKAMTRGRTAGSIMDRRVDDGKI